MSSLMSTAHTVDGVLEVSTADASAILIKEAIKEARRENNRRSSWYFAISMVVLMVIFTFTHWIDVFLTRRSDERPGTVSRIELLARRVRSVLIKEIPGFSSVGHFVVFVIYATINIALVFEKVDMSVLEYWAVRCGWAASWNVALATFLGLKNTPLAFLTSYSYDRLNVLHQAVGYCTVLFAAIHGITYTVAYAQNDELSDLATFKNQMGEMAGFAMLIILISVVMRKRQYELFYIVHIFMFIILIIGMGYHRPIKRVSSWTFACFAGGVWILDRLLRLARIVLFNFLGNEASVVTLPCEGVRIVLRRTPLLAKPGAHIFLWLPGVRPFETHPYTIVSTNPTEIVISAQNGFSRSLYNKAASQAGDTKFRVSVDGPYGTLPNFQDFSRVIFVAAGSGASFTFGCALDMLAKVAKRGCVMPEVHFIWSVRQVEQLSWYGSQLGILAAQANVFFHVHITRSNVRMSSETNEGGVIYDGEKSVAPTSVTAVAADIEKSSTSTETDSKRASYIPEMLTLNYGRVKLEDKLLPMLEMQRGGKTIVAACGPDGMMSDVRNAVAKDLKRGGDVRLHCESFGW